ncbi:MAG TPA: TIR domain-containing protein [Thermoanaerobaculia bacterium]|nr:TIR domain-containing protein [Thermoanaerobaculia bacterium]
MKVFLSHASEQAEVARSIEVALQSEGHSVFLDRLDLPPGESFNDRIRRAIAASDLFVFLISPEAVAGGRYTLTELEFVEEKWRHPSGYVLPVMVRATELGSLPAYLKAVTVLEPQGNVAADVAAAVARFARPWWRRFGGRWATALAIALVGAGAAGWWGYRHWITAQEVSGLLKAGGIESGSGDFAAAWDTLGRAASLAPGSRDVALARERLAMGWLDNIHGTFTPIVEKVEPVLSRCAATNEARRAADCLAHLGWGDFLRQREGAGGLSAVERYRRAIELDPENPYAHVMWGFDILWHGGEIAESKAHFAKALASGRERAYVRQLQLSAFLLSQDFEPEGEALRVLNEMRAHQETIDGNRAGQSETLRRHLWDVYYDALINHDHTEQILAPVPAAEHVAIFRWLFPDYATSENNRDLYRRMLARLEERAGPGRSGGASGLQPAC